MVSQVEEGLEAPDFCLPSDDGNTYCLRDFRGKWVVLYFYPRDNTSGCTREALDFTSRLNDFQQLNAVVIGVSPDSIESHKKFRFKHGLKVILLSDTSHEVLEKYGVWGKKKRYGKEFFGVIRSTFLIDPDGRIRKLWRNVRVAGHVEEVLQALKSLQS